MAQSFEPKYFEGIMDVALGMDFIFGSHSPWDKMGINDKNDSRAHRQLNKESLELHDEEESIRFYENIIRYIRVNLGIIKNKKDGFLKKS